MESSIAAYQTPQPAPPDRSDGAQPRTENDYETLGESGATAKDPRGPSERGDAGGLIRVIGKDDESVRITTSQLEQAIEALFRLEEERQSVRAWALRNCRRLDEIPQRLQQRLDLLLRF